MLKNVVLLFYRYKPPPSNGPAEDPTPDYMNLLGMIFSMCGLMMKVGYHIQPNKWERSGSVVECFARDGEAAGLSLTGITALCP